MAFLLVPPAPSSTMIKSASTKAAPISVPPSISKSAKAKLPSGNTGAWLNVTTPFEAIAIESVSEADPIFPASGITTFPPVVRVPPPFIVPAKVTLATLKEAAVVDPDLIFDKFGADTARLFMLSDSPPEKDLEWTDTGIKGAYKYLNRLWDLITKNLKILIKQKKNIKDFKKKEEFISAINQTIYNVTLDYENFRFNRAIARIREFTNILFENEETLKENNELFKFLLENVIKIFSPMAPHITEEMWKLLGNKNFFIESGWPVADKKYLKIENIR